MKNLKISVCFFLTAGFLLTAGTAAYLSASDQKVNTLAVGHVTTEIEENFPDPTPTPVEERIPPILKKSGQETFPVVKEDFMRIVM